MTKPLIDPDTLPDEAFVRMNITREEFRQRQIKKAERETSAPVVGSMAPDFTLERLSPAGQRTSQQVRLSDSRGRPVALVFGSYT